MNTQTSSYKSLINQLTKKLNQTTDLQEKEEIEDQLVRLYDLEEEEAKQTKQDNISNEQENNVSNEQEDDLSNDSDNSDEKDDKKDDKKDKKNKKNKKDKKDKKDEIDKSLLSEEELRELVRQERLEKQIKNEEKYLKKSKLKNEEEEFLRDKMMNDALAFDDDYANQKKRRTFGNKNK
jgi:hypothetical protein